MKCKRFPMLLSKVEINAWNSFMAIISNFLGNNKAENYEQIVKEMIRNFGKMKVNQSLKIHFLESHLDFFPKNLGEFSDEHGEKFHQEIALIEGRFKGKNSCRMLEEYLWTICRSNCSINKRKCNKSVYVTSI